MLHRIGPLGLFERDRHRLRFLNGHLHSSSIIDSFPLPLVIDWERKKPFLKGTVEAEAAIAFFKRDFHSRLEIDQLRWQLLSRKATALRIFISMAF